MKKSIATLALITLASVSAFAISTVAPKSLDVYLSIEGETTCAWTETPYSDPSQPLVGISADKDVSAVKTFYASVRTNEEAVSIDITKSGDLTNADAGTTIPLTVTADPSFSDTTKGLRALSRKVDVSYNEEEFKAAASGRYTATLKMTVTAAS